MAVRRGGSFSEAVFEGEKEVEGIRAKLITEPEEAEEVWRKRQIPVLIDPEAKRARDFLKPDVLIDAILAKNNGTIITGKNSPLMHAASALA